MGECFSSSDSFLRVLFQHFYQEFVSIGVNLFILFTFKGNVACPVLGKNFVVGFSWEGANSEEKNVEDQSQTENIADGVILCLHIFDVDDFRSNVAGCAASDEEIFLCICELGKSKVSNDAFLGVL